MKALFITLGSLLSLGLAVSGGGCGQIVPSGQGTGDAAPPDVIGADAGNSDADAAVPTRTVETRNPFGNLTPENLVLDGDFEFTGRQGQMPWLSFSDAQGVLDFETGGLCASGVRCGKLGKGGAIFGWMASPKAGQDILVTLKIRTLVGTPHAKPAAGVCPEPSVNVYVIDIDDQTEVARIELDPAAAPVNGFCSYSTAIAAMPNASPGIYIEADDFKTDDVVLIDGAVATAVPAGTTRSHRLVGPSRAVDHGRVNAMIEWVRRHRKTTAPRPTAPLK